MNSHWWRVWEGRTQIDSEYSVVCICVSAITVKLFVVVLILFFELCPQTAPQSTAFPATFMWTASHWWGVCPSRGGVTVWSIFLQLSMAYPSWDKRRPLLKRQIESYGKTYRKMTAPKCFCMCVRDFVNCCCHDVDNCAECQEVVPVHPSQST